MIAMKTILAPIDFSDATRPVLDAAANLARAFQAKIVVTHVVRPASVVLAYSPDVAGLELEAEDDEARQLLSWQREVRGAGLAVEAIELCGEPEACIREEAKRLGADFIVVGSHRHGVLHDLLFGGTTAGLLKNAPCPVVIVPVSGVKPGINGSCAEAAPPVANASPERTPGRF